MPDKNTLKIIFNISGRTNYLYRYSRLLENYKINFDLLIINDLNNIVEDSYMKKINTNVITRQARIKITGMNSIFRSMYNCTDILQKYKYVCFVEDDNFIFPNAIDNCVNFLNINHDFLGCNGLSFLFNYNKNNKFIYLAKYSSPSFKSDNPNDRAKQYKSNGGLIYYSVIRSVIFLKICKEITHINDDNLSEIFFNYLVLIYGNLKTINNVYLAREYPRPIIYNIPDLNEWILNNKLAYDINMVIIRLKKNLLMYKANYDFNLFLKLTIFYYISNKINPMNLSSSNNFLYNLKKKLSNTNLKNKIEIKNFFNQINFKL